MRNAHERSVQAPATTVGGLLDQLAADDDPVWPTPAWPPLVLDRPLGVGADGGHGPIRYRVSEYEPGRRIRFAFHPVVGIRGYHELSVEPAGDDRCVVRHVVSGRLAGRTRLAWPVAVRWLHDALIEDLLDNVELAATGRVARPARWSWWVRRLRARFVRRAARRRSAVG